MLKWIAAIIGPFFLGLCMISYLYAVSLRQAGIIEGRGNLKLAWKNYHEHGYVTNYSSSYQVWLSTNVVTVGKTNYQCFITVREAKFYGGGVLAMTTNQIFIWLDAKHSPKIIDDSYKVPRFPLGF